MLISVAVVVVVVTAMNEVVARWRWREDKVDAIETP